MSKDFFDNLDTRKKGAVYDDEGNIVVDPASETNPDYSSISVIDMNTMNPICLITSDEDAEARRRKIIDEISKYQFTARHAIMSTMHGWVARDKDGRLYLHSKKPKRVGILGGWDSTSYMELDNGMFPDVTFDTDAQYVSIALTPIKEPE